MLTRRKRRMLFWLSIAAFFLLLGPVLAYSLGYRLGEGFSIEKTGGIFIKASHDGAEIYIEEKLKKTTSFLSRSALIKNVSPGIHKVRIALDGHWDWEKRIDVLSEQVVSKNVLLVPKDAKGKILSEKPAAEDPFLKKTALYIYENGKEKLLFSGVKNFWRLSGGQFLILGADGDFYIGKNKLSGEFSEEALRDLKNYPNAFFSDRDQRIVLWDSRNIDSLWVGQENRLPMWQKDIAINIYTSPKGAAIRQVFAYPGWPDYLLIAMQNGIFALEMDSSGGQNMTPIYKGKIPEIILIKDGKIFVEDDGNYLEIMLP